MNAEGLWTTVSRTSQSTQRPLLTADDLLMLSETENGRLAVVFVVDRPPILVYLTSACKLPVFSTVLESSNVLRRKNEEEATSSAIRPITYSALRDQTGRTGMTASFPVSANEGKAARTIIEKRVTPPSPGRNARADFSKLLIEADREPESPTTSTNDW